MGKRFSREDVTDAWAGWAGQDGFGLRGQRGQQAGWARGRMGHKVGRAENKEKGISELKNWIFEFTKALEMCRMRFRRNFDMRIFPKLF
jgi:hypothetical protein